MANMLYLESPKGVGFSYCDNADTESDCVNTVSVLCPSLITFLVNSTLTKWYMHRTSPLRKMRTNFW